MARAIIHPEQQIQRINTLINALNDLRSIDQERMLHSPSEKAWNGVQVMEHMIIAHQVYHPKVEGALKKLDSSDPIESVRSRAVPSYLIKRFPPIDGQIKFKMKTMNRFQPVPSSVYKSDVFDQLEQTLVELKSWVNSYRSKNVRSVKFNSAIGPLVRFNVAEACEFILCHNERHFKQIENLINA